MRKTRSISHGCDLEAVSVQKLLGWLLAAHVVPLAIWLEGKIVEVADMAQLCI